MKFLLVFTSFLYIQNVWADAQTLPQGVYRARLVSTFIEPIQYKYNENNERVDLMYDLNSSITIDKMKKGNADLTQLYNLSYKIDSQAADQLMQADLISEATMKPMKFVPALEYGISERISFGVKIPIVKMDVEASFNAKVADNIDVLAEKSKGIETAENAYKTLMAKYPTSESLAESIFTSKGYKVPSDFSYSGLGDVEVGGRFKLYESSRLVNSIESGLRLPTASSTPRQNNLLYKGTGDGQLDFALRNMMEIKITSKLTLDTFLSYEYQFADKIDWSTPPNYDSSLPEDSQVNLDAKAPLLDLNNSDYKGQVSRKLGDLWEAELGLSYKMFNDAWTASTAYNFSGKLSDKYSGDKNLNYNKLSEDTDKDAQMVNVALGYSTIPMFKAKRFSVPGEVKFAYFKTLRSRNATEVNYGRLDLIMYIK